MSPHSAAEKHSTKNVDGNESRRAGRSVPPLALTCVGVHAFCILSSFVEGSDRGSRNERIVFAGFPALLNVSNKRS